MPSKTQLANGLESGTSFVRSLTVNLALRLHLTSVRVVWKSARSTLSTVLISRDTAMLGLARVVLTIPLCSLFPVTITALFLSNFSPAKKRTQKLPTC